MYEIIIISILVLLIVCNVKQFFSIKSLSRKIEIIEDEKIEQLDAVESKYKKELDEKLDSIRIHADSSLSALLDKFTLSTGEMNEKFKKALTSAREEAEDLIKFEEIEYKKTITKKRKEYNRKNGHLAKPQRQWRYIDEE